MRPLRCPPTIFFRQRYQPNINPHRVLSNSSSSSGGNDTPFLHRTRLTNMLWKHPMWRPPLDGPKKIMKSTEPYIPAPKRMKDSYCEIVLPFRQDKSFREEYANIYGGLRIGKLMEDLDAFAASISFKHCSSPDGEHRTGWVIVTASVDRIDLLNPVRPDYDMRFSGHLTYVGTSSMEVTIPETSKWAPLMLCKFTMVARDSVSGTPAKVNKLILETDTEKKLFALGEESKRLKLESINTDLMKQPPTPDERLIIHSLWLETRDYEDSKGQVQQHLIPPHITFMEDTRLSTMRICQPQERNIHHSVFGGYLMREAYELAFTTASSYLNHLARPHFVALDDLSFRKPVPIGSFLRFTSRVVYAEGGDHKTFQVSVVAEVCRPAQPPARDLDKWEDSNDDLVPTWEITNTFHYTFAKGPIEQSGIREPLHVEQMQVDRLVPRTYGEAMLYLQGYRRKNRGVQFKKRQLREFESLRLEDNQNR